MGGSISIQRFSGGIPVICGKGQQHGSNHAGILDGLVGQRTSQRASESVRRYPLTWVRVPASPPLFFDLMLHFRFAILGLQFQVCNFRFAFQVCIYIPMYSALITVSYTHLTLPTICSVQISVVAVSLKKKKKQRKNRIEDKEKKQLEG
eukprot:TRINITY_DN16006_c0_g1_i1.p3 TRINITY_DN16006_c0_g1~~TRINITY_DN16006_c0_g1_i1.p3  ORF type:complete len:149 (-),score=8.71 TRINITY_DN16006_c0_g1_i1:29-475(-)